MGINVIAWNLINEKIFSFGCKNSNLEETLKYMSHYKLFYHVAFHLHLCNTLAQSTEDPRFTRFQFARIHIASFFRAPLRSMGTEPLGFQKIGLKPINVEKFNDTLEL